MSNQKISVVIGTYNFAKYLRECIESVLAQTLSPSEIIICDDHSSDNSWLIISEYKERYPRLIRAYRHDRNLGPAENGNFGLHMARGDLVSQIEGDDRWLPKKLELEWESLRRHPEAKIAYSNVYIIGAEGNRTGIWYDGKGPSPPSGDVFVEVFSRRFFLNTRSVFRNELVSRFVLDEEGYCDESLESYWDWDRKIRYSARFPVVYSGEALVEYRQHEGGFSKSQPEKHFRAMVKVYEKNLPLLDQRTKKEAIQVRCNIESLLALGQIHLPLSNRLSYYSANNAYERNRVLLGQLPKHEHRALEKEIASLLGQLVQQIAMEEFEKGNRRLAFKYWLGCLRYSLRGFDLKLLVKVIFPRQAYSLLKSVYNNFHKLTR